jgi:gas vesicle protein
MSKNVTKLIEETKLFEETHEALFAVKENIKTLVDVWEQDNLDKANELKLRYQALSDEEKQEFKAKYPKENPNFNREWFFEDLVADE